MLFLIFTAVLWSTSGMMIKLSDWSPMAIMGGRSVLAVIVFLVHLRGRRFRITRLHLLGAGAFLATQIMFITSTKMTTAANAIFLQYTSPVTVVLLAAWWLRERPDRADWVTMAVVMTGMVFFFGDRLSFDGMVGNVLALLSGVTMAVMTVALRAQKDGTPAETMLLSYVIASLIGIPWVVREAWTPGNLAIIAFLGVFQIGLACVFYSAAIKHVRALESTLIVTLEPILNPVWVFLAVGEQPGAMALLGGALVVAGVALRAVLSARVLSARAKAR